MTHHQRPSKSLAQATRSERQPNTAADPSAEHSEPPIGFQDLGLVEPLLKALAQAGYPEPTPIQRAAIPPALAGRDVLACAQTGTGKTAAFALPMLQRISQVVSDEPAIRGLVLTPTRELAGQVGESLRRYGQHLDLWHATIFGGVNQVHQLRELRKGVDILVATPGRLLDLIQQGHVPLDRVSFFVLDEVDRMLDMGFLPDVRRILARLPKARQTLLFSATIPKDIRVLAKQLLRDPEEVSVTPSAATEAQIAEHVYFVEKEDKRRLLLKLIAAGNMAQTLVFSRTKHGANRIASALTQAGIQAAAIHGNKSQAARVRALESFRARKLAVLVATDVAARGIDVEGISHVVNFDLPNLPETYVHRIGRTGRAGATGQALSFCDAEERPHLSGIEQLTKRHLVRVASHPFPPRFSVPSTTRL